MEARFQLANKKSLIYFILTNSEQSLTKNMKKKTFEVKIAFNARWRYMHKIRNNKDSEQKKT